MKTFTIAGQAQIPAIGLGTWKSNKGEAGQAVASGLTAGYRHLDCAPIYMNEKEIGEVLGSALGSGQVKRDELWVTSKLWNNSHRQQDVRPALERTLRDLRLDYLDLYLIHWPIHFRAEAFFAKSAADYLPESEIPAMETWQAMEKLVKDGLCRFIGVCNHNMARLGTLLADCEIAPAMNQIELHPHLAQNEMLHFCREQGILLTAYSPLGSPDRPAALKKKDEPSLLTNPVIAKLAAKHDCNPGQLLIAWALDRGTVAIPKSVNPERIAGNLQAIEINLDDEDRQTIATLDSNFRYVDGSFFTGPGSPYHVSELW